MLSSCKIGVAMSGGVDSAVTALLLREQGYEVHGFFMRLPLPETEQQGRRAQKIASEIGIPLEILDLRQQFSAHIIDDFVRQYRQGKTPNPCVVCNQRIKFGALLKMMLDRGMDKGATGHYACVKKSSQGYRLFRGDDPLKDQSYFLCRLRQEQLAHALFPLGNWTKKDVYAMASSFGLSVCSGDESQDVCFLSSGLHAFLSDQGVQDVEGEIYSFDGRVLGRHHGISRYTIGQRRGLGISDATPWYVVALDAETNRVIVGKNNNLYDKEIFINDLHWIGSVPDDSWQAAVQLRSRHIPASACVERISEEVWRITCDEPQRAITPGQFAVFYKGDRVVGSGIIVQKDQDIERELL